MPKLPIMNSLRHRWKRSIPSNILKAGPVLNLREGEALIATYTSAANKMKIFSAFLREGLEDGDAVFYIYPDEESETVRAKLGEHGIDVEKYEKDGVLYMKSLTEHFMRDGIFDKERAIQFLLNRRSEADNEGYEVRELEDVGDFSFLKGQWQTYIDYWHDPRWFDPRFAESKETVGVVFKPYVMEITAVNLEGMTELRVTELLKAFGRGTRAPARFMDLLENLELFSKSIALSHDQLIGRKILLEFDPASNYEKLIDNLAKESMANVEPIFVFTSNTSPIHAHLAKQPTIKFFLTSVSASVQKSSSENEMLLPARNTSLILDALDKVLEMYVDANVCFVFDILSELLTSIGREKTFAFLHYALDMLSSEKITSLFLLNADAHGVEAVSCLRSLFGNQLNFGKNGLKVVKTS